VTDAFVEFNPEDSDFRIAFWEWFDALPRTQKEEFWYYPGDPAMFFYYNQIYRKILTSK